jgi:trehalose utilization protein
MAVTYTWMVHSMATKPSVSGVSNAVQKIYWECQGREGSSMMRAQGCVELADPDPENFVNYDDLTEDDVLNWVWGNVGKEKVEDALASRVSKKTNPTTVSLPNPWE